MANSLNAVAVSQYVDANGQIQKSYSNIGRAFETKTGWIVRLNALPIPSLNDKGLVETVIMLMPPKDGQQPTPTRGGQGHSRSANYAPDDDNSIPF